MSETFRVEVRTYDAVIVGGGGAGAFAALELAPHARVAVLSKLYPVRSHTGAAQGGIGAALGNVEEDHWEWHMFDTVKGSDYLADQDAAEVLCREAVDVVYQLEHWGLPFSRTPDGRIDQRRFGGHTRNNGEAPVRRSCYAADRTGHMILQTLWQQCTRLGVETFDEFMAVDLLMQDSVCAGVVAWDIRRGGLTIFHAQAVLLATGGWGRMFDITSNALACTGDGPAMAFRRGIPLEDMEFFQFHPTGIAGMGILITEGARGEGGVMVNGRGERFMEQVSPTLKDLAPRDIVARAIHREIHEGRGIQGRNFVHLDLTHLPPDTVREKLPDITDFVQTYLGLDPTERPIPVQPTAHYAMGGIPTDLDGRVRGGVGDDIVLGLWAAGECACVSVHGANRLGTNSLVDILVFGRRAAHSIQAALQSLQLRPLPADAAGPAQQILLGLLTRERGEHAAAVREELQRLMTLHVAVERNAASLSYAVRFIGELQDRAARLILDDHGLTMNTELMEALELLNLLDVAEATTASALHRTESRGAHFRADFPERDDAAWLQHTLIRRTMDGLEFGGRHVVITRFAPKPRTY